MSDFELFWRIMLGCLVWLCVMWFCMGLMSLAYFELFSSRLRWTLVALSVFVSLPLAVALGVIAIP